MIKKIKLLTIITVVKNDNKRLKKTLNSLKNIYKIYNFEHIIVENLDSKKNNSISKQLVKKYFIKYINDENNENGIYNAMNIGINEANTTYSLFLNAGDTLLLNQEKLSKVIKIINKNYFYANIICLKSVLSLNKKKIPLIPNKHFLYNMPTSHQAMLFKTSFLKKYKFNLKYKVASDFDLVLKAKKNDIAFLDCMDPIIEIEYGGFSSKNYLKSYFEYFEIIFLNKTGKKKIKALTLLFTKFVIICVFKVFFKETTLFNIKRKVNQWTSLKI